MKKEKIMNIEEAIEALQISKPTFYRWLKSGRVKGTKVGRQWKFYQKDIERLLQGEGPEITIKGDVGPIIRQVETFIHQYAEKKINLSHLSCDLLERLCLMLVMATNVSKATDIHLSATMDSDRHQSIGVIRLRIQGVLKTIATFDSEQVQGIVEKWMALSQCDLHQRSIPQDGRVQYELNEIHSSLPNQKIDILTSFTPSFFGTSMTARVLNVNVILDRLDMKTFGFCPKNITTIEKVLKSSYGLVLVSSPPHHGKTTLILSFLKTVADPSLKVASIENPIEVVIPWTTQTQVNKPQGLRYLNGLRSIMRTDPDVVMVSELDESDQLLEMGIDIANEGHLLIGAIQGKSVLDSLDKVLTLYSNKRGMIAEALKIVVSQRLLRRLCPHCKQKHKPTKAQVDQLAEFGPVPAKFLNHNKFFRAKGCPKCFDGYIGRFAIEEVLAIGAKVKSAILKERELTNIGLQKLDPSFRPFHIRGLECVGEGKTSLEELLRCLNL